MKKSSKESKAKPAKKVKKPIKKKPRILNNGDKVGLEEALEALGPVMAEIIITVHKGGIKVKDTNVDKVMALQVFESLASALKMEMVHELMDKVGFKGKSPKEQLQEVISRAIKVD